MGETKHHPFSPTFMFCSLENCVKEREERKERGEREREGKEREKGGKNGQECERREVCLREKGEEERDTNHLFSHSLLFISLHQREREVLFPFSSLLCVLKDEVERERRGRRGCEEKNKPSHNTKNTKHTHHHKTARWWLVRLAKQITHKTKQKHNKTKTNKQKQTERRERSLLFSSLSPQKTTKRKKKKERDFFLEI